MSCDKSGAIAIFVKTPELSPVKTRLAVSIGSSAAEGFYLLSAKAVESVVEQASKAHPGITPYWAVAEEEGLKSPHWKQFEGIWQGEGGLGHRLSHVYDQLLERHSFVIFIGADSPQITSHILKEGASILSQAKTAMSVMGRAEDGGFYLFGGTSPISKEDWLSVPYSSTTTAEALTEKLKAHRHVHELQWLLDVDTLDDMKRLTSEIARDTLLTIEQQALMSWLLNFKKEKKYE